jgi:hypothetical protein
LDKASRLAKIFKPSGLHTEQAAQKKNRNSLAAALQISSGNSHFIMKRSVQDYKETLEVFLARKGAPHFCMNTTTSYQ